nr:MAG TPA: hypothetical protein [Bacteriophage sp.]
MRGISVYCCDFEHSNINPACRKNKRMSSISTPSPYC